MTLEAPHLDWAGLSPVVALTAGLCLVLAAGLLKPPRQRWAVSALTAATLAATAGLLIWQWGESKDLVAGALRLDDLSIAVSLIAVGAAAFVLPLALREPAAAEDRHGEFQVLLLGSLVGMVLLAQAQNLVSLFVALELLSVPLYVLCGAAIRRAGSLESGLKYLIIGSLGSATLLYGLAFLYGASGSTDFVAVSEAISERGLAGDALVLIGIGLAVTGLAFKVSLAPFHQWTPDVYQGAPTPVTAFMAVATKVAAFGVFVRLFVVALGPSVGDWQAALAALAVASIAIGNVGALGQDSLKRLLGYSGIAQAGYILCGLVVATELGLEALVFYLAAYALMTLPAFAVVVVRERETPFGDDIRALDGLGRERPELAWPVTISMLALAGLPGTAGFIGKVFLISAAVEGGYTWLGVAIVIGTMISLAYYLRVVAAVWMRPAAQPAAADAEGAEAAKAQPAIAGGSPQADAAGGGEAAEPGTGGPPGTRCKLILVPTVIVAAATVFFGVIPEPLADWASSAAEALGPFLERS